MIRRLFKTVVFIVFFVLVCLLPSSLLAADSAEKRILFLSSYHPGFPTFFQQIDGIKSVFEENSVLLDVEFMDSKRFPDEENIDLFARTLTLKLSRTKPYDLLITADDNALAFVLERQEELFKGLPIVFLGVNNVERALQQNANPAVTGVVEAVSIKETLETIVQLHSEVNKIVAIVDDTPSGQGDLRTYYQLKETVAPVDLVDISLKELTFEELARRLRNLDPQAAVLLLSAYRDKDGTSLLFHESLELIRENLSRPLYHLWYHGMNDGVLGGKLVSHHQQGRAAAQIAVRILAGESVADIAVTSESPNPYLFDYVEMQRFELKNDDLPPGSIILNEPRDYYQDNKTLIWTFLTIFIGYSLLVAAMWISIQRRKRAEVALRESEERFERMFRNHKAVMLIVDPADGTIVDANDAACRYYGHRLAELRALRIQDINTLPDDEVEGNLEKARSGEQDYFEFRHRLASDEIRDVEVHSSPVVVDKQTFLFSIIHDITEQKRMQAQAIRASQLASLGELSAGVAHEVNNPIGGVINYAEILKMRTEDEKSLDLLDRIVREGERIANIVRKLLSFSRNTETEFKTHTVEDLLDVPVSLIGAQLRKEGIAVEVRIEPRSMSVRCNAHQIEQVLLNLLSNSRHALNEKFPQADEKKKIDITARKIDAKGGGQLRIEVVDFGDGIPEDRMSRILSPFYTTKGANVGTGLGLSISDEIVRSHHGTLNFESLPGEYTRAIIEIPFAGAVKKQ